MTKLAKYGFLYIRTFKVDLSTRNKRAPTMEMDLGLNLGSSNSAVVGNSPARMFGMMISRPFFGAEIIKIYYSEMVVRLGNGRKA